MPDELRLQPLQPEEYAAWAATERDEYARDISENGDTPIEAARQKADRDMEEILPQGLETPNHWMFWLEHAGERAGRLWLSERVIDGRRSMFIFDIHVNEAYRGRGFGRAAMLLTEREARSRG